MRTLLLGVDSGTQSTKVLVVNAKNGKVIAAASQTYDLIPNLPPGAKEQHPRTWRDATARAIRQSLKAAKAGAAEVKAIGVSGQQHGFVPLDQAGQVIRPAKLWCDTSTAAECEEITARLGGLQGAIRAVGNAILPGYTAPKILWLKKREPKNYARLATVLLPHDYLNFWLTGEKVMEYGDASGTVLLEVRTGRWSDAAIGAIDPGLREKLPPLISSDQPAGSLQAATARALGLNSGTLVSAGGGDNMMGAIGTGNTRQGVITASFGTSGTIYACSEKPVIDPQGEIGAFCDSTNRWLPLLCTMNVTVATEMVRQDFGMDVKTFDATVAKARPGADGLILLPYLEGERAGRHRRLPGCDAENLHRGAFCPRGDGRGDAGHELRFAPAGRTGREAEADSRDRRRREVQGMAANHGRHFQLGGGDAEGQRRRGLRRGAAGPLVLETAAGRKSLHQ